MALGCAELQGKNRPLLWHRAISSEYAARGREFGQRGEGFSNTKQDEDAEDGKRCFEMLRMAVLVRKDIDESASYPSVRKSRSQWMYVKNVSGDSYKSSGIDGEVGLTAAVTDNVLEEWYER